MAHGLVKNELRFAAKSLDDKPVMAFCLKGNRDQLRASKMDDLDWGGCDWIDLRDFFGEFSHGCGVLRSFEVRELMLGALQCASCGVFPEWIVDLDGT